MDCGEYQKNNRWLRNRIVLKMTEGDISVRCDEYQNNNSWLRNTIVMEMTEGIVFEG